MVVRNGINASFYIGQILEEKLRHIGVDALSIEHRGSGADAAFGSWLLSFASGVGEFAKQETVSQIPSDSGNLGHAVSDMRGIARESEQHSNNS
jgi:hypothetical protein